MSNTTLLVIQPEENDVNKPLPYPWYVNENGIIQKQEFWKGDPKSLVGFTPPGQQEIIITRAELFKDKSKLDECKKLHPVLCTEKGKFYSITRECTLKFINASKPTIAETAIEVLKKNDCDSISWNDSRLISEICSRLKDTHKLPKHPLDKRNHILNALEKSKKFTKTHYLGNGKLSRNFQINETETK